MNKIIYKNEVWATNPDIVTKEKDGLMSKEDKQKLDNMTENFGDVGNSTTPIYFDKGEPKETDLSNTYAAKKYLQDIDANTVIDEGFYSCEGMVGTPSTTETSGTLIVGSSSGFRNYIRQIWLPESSTKMYTRFYNAGDDIWEDWKSLFQADTAASLTCGKVGSESIPVYFDENGKPVALDYDFSILVTEYLKKSGDSGFVLVDTSETGNPNINITADKDGITLQNNDDYMTIDYNSITIEKDNKTSTIEPTKIELTDANDKKVEMSTEDIKINDKSIVTDSLYSANDNNVLAEGKIDEVVKSWIKIFNEKIIAPITTIDQVLTADGLKQWLEVYNKDIQDILDLIEGLPKPVQFKGSLGVDGTITALPEAAEANEGFTYIVITSGEYVIGEMAKLGDLYISNGKNWVLVPSGDEPSGTVISVNAEGDEEVITVKIKDSEGTESTEPITEAGTISIAHKESGVTANTYADNDSKTHIYNEDSIVIPKVVIDKYGHITSAKDKTINLHTLKSFSSFEAIIEDEYEGSFGITKSREAGSLGEPDEYIKGIAYKTLETVTFPQEFKYYMLFTRDDKTYIRIYETDKTYVEKEITTDLSSFVKYGDNNVNKTIIVSNGEEENFVATTIENNSIKVAKDSSNGAFIDTEQIKVSSGDYSTIIKDKEITIWDNNSENSPEMKITNSELTAMSGAYDKTDGVVSSEKIGIIGREDLETGEKQPSTYMTQTEIYENDKKLSDKYVTLDTEQTITAKKDFNGGLDVGNDSVTISAAGRAKFKNDFDVYGTDRGNNSNLKIRSSRVDILKTDSSEGIGGRSAISAERKISDSFGNFEDIQVLSRGDKSDTHSGIHLVPDEINIRMTKANGETYGFRAAYSDTNVSALGDLNLRGGEDISIQADNGITIDANNKKTEVHLGQDGITLETENNMNIMSKDISIGYGDGESSIQYQGGNDGGYHNLKLRDGYGSYIELNKGYYDSSVGKGNIDINGLTYLYANPENKMTNGQELSTKQYLLNKGYTQEEIESLFSNYPSDDSENKKSLQENLLDIKKSISETSGMDSRITNNASKNLLDCSKLEVKTINGVTFTPFYDSNGLLEYINVNGTCVNQNAWYGKIRVPLIIGKTYILSGGSNASGMRHSVYKLDDNTLIANDDTGKSATFTATEDGCYWYIGFNKDETANNIKIYPMVRYADIKDSTYEPYYPTNVELANGSARDDSKVKLNDDIFLQHPHGIIFGDSNYKGVIRTNEVGSEFYFMKAQKNDQSKGEAASDYNWITAECGIGFTEDDNVRIKSKNKNIELESDQVHIETNNIVTISAEQNSTEVTLGDSFEVSTLDDLQLDASAGVNINGGNGVYLGLTKGREAVSRTDNYIYLSPMKNIELNSDEIKETFARSYRVMDNNGNVYMLVDTNTESINLLSNGNMDLKSKGDITVIGGLNNYSQTSGSSAYFLKTGNIKGIKNNDTREKPTITNFSDIHSTKFEVGGHVDLVYDENSECLNFNFK